MAAIPVIAAAPAAGAAPSAPTRELPFTGIDAAIDRVLLAGALFVLTGMLVQIAGQPLPARAATRRPAD